MAICPCRRVGDRAGGRAQYQLCEFALVRTIDQGHFGEMDLAELQVVMAGYWDEDEPGAPWRVRRPSLPAPGGEEPGPTPRSLGDLQPAVGPAHHGGGD